MPLPPRTWLADLAATAAGHRLTRAIVARFEASIEGVAHVPSMGGALLVGNHTLGGVDSVVLTALLVENTTRVPRFLAEKKLFEMPGLDELLRAVGAIPGAPDPAVALLEAGEVVVVYPGGVDDSFKPSSEAHTLKWGARAGFARIAMRARVPIVPVVATGIDELFEVPRRERRIGRWLFGSPRYDLPVPSNLMPRRVPLTYVVRPPVDTSGDPADPAAVERVRAATWSALEEVLAVYRSRLR